MRNASDRVNNIPTLTQSIRAWQISNSEIMKFLAAIVVYYSFFMGIIVPRNRAKEAL
ncbi:MAG: hypothetical protein AB4290_28195 [Spirulina sp.]